jgi:hypothetical protein
MDYYQNNDDSVREAQAHCVNGYYMNSLLLFSIDGKLLNQVGGKRKTRTIKNSYVSNLSEMQSALFILKCLSEGKDEGYLIQRFDNDEQLVRIWMNLLIELNLLVVNVVGEYVITNKGKDYLQKYNPHW